MTHETLALGLAAVLWTAAAVQEKPKKDAAALPKKGDPVVLEGCLRGGALESAEVAAEDSDVPVASGLTFRVTGNKSLLKDMKQKAEGRLIEIRGLLKSELLPQDGYGTKLGRMRVTIGTPSANPGSAAAEANRSIPVVEVKSFEATETTCAR